MSDWYDYVPFVGIIALVGALLFNNNRIYETASSVNELNFHNHGPAAPGMPRDLDGELIYTLDGVRGWY